MPALSTTSSVSGAFGTGDPTVNHDGLNGWAIGDTYLNTTTGVLWFLASAAQAAAVWYPLPQGQSNALIGILKGANMNVTTDQPIAMLVPTGSAFSVSKISVKNASISLTTAAGGVYNAVSKGGVAIVAAAQAYSALTTAIKRLDLTVAVTDVQVAATLLYLSLTTGQGAGSTADVYVFGDVWR